MDKRQRRILKFKKFVKRLKQYYFKSSDDFEEAKRKYRSDSGRFEFCLTTGSPHKNRRAFDPKPPRAGKHRKDYSEEYYEELNYKELNYKENERN